MALRGRNFTLVQFATYTYAQNVVHSFVAPKNSQSFEAECIQVTA
jgi:hypothetical protein